MITVSGKAIMTERIPADVISLAVIPQKQKIVPAALPPIRKKPYVHYVEVNMENG